MAKKSSKSDSRKISEMRNLGPACEKDLNEVGITKAQQLISLGAEGAFLKMLEGRRNAGQKVQCCNAVYLYAMYGAIHDIDWRQIPESKKNEFKDFTRELRASGRFSG